MTLTVDEIETAAAEYTTAAVGYPAPAYIAWTLARWAAYPDPAELPEGWTLDDQMMTATGIRQYATAPRVGLFVDVPARRIPWTCPAGVEHRRYWRSIHHPNRPRLFACEHQPEPVAA